VWGGVDLQGVWCACGWLYIACGAEEAAAPNTPTTPPRHFPTGTAPSLTRTPPTSRSTFMRRATAQASWWVALCFVCSASACQHAAVSQRISAPLCLSVSACQRAAASQHLSVSACQHAAAPQHLSAPACRCVSASLHASVPLHLSISASSMCHWVSASQRISAPACRCVSASLHASVPLHLSISASSQSAAGSQRLTQAPPAAIRDGSVQTVYLSASTAEGGDAGLCQRRCISRKLLLRP